MAILDSCCCCSLLSAAISLGVSSSFLYGTAFAVEMWWIVEAEVSLSVPAYILAASYLLMCALSLAMVLSLRSKLPGVLLSWLLLTVLYIFPEAGLVLFMSIYHWGGGTYGVIEISLWLVRVLFNVCGIVCVQSLWSRWREERSIFRSLHELSINHGGVSGVEHDLGIPGHHKLRGSLRFQPALHPRFVPAVLGSQEGSQSAPGLHHYRHNLGYNNPAFSGSTMQLNTSKWGAGQPLQRAASTAARPPARPPPGPAHLPPYQAYSKNEFNPMMFRSPRPLSHSQFDLPSFGLDPDAPVFIQRGHGPGGLPLNIYRGDSRRDQLLSTESQRDTMEWYRPRSLSSLPPPPAPEDGPSLLSERWTTGRRQDYSTQSLDRRLARGGAFHSSYHSDSGGQGPSLGSRQSLGQLSVQSVERYRDIAL